MTIFTCQYANGKGIRCSAPAFYRVQFSREHPFDFVDLCKEHKDEYRGVRVEYIGSDEESIQAPEN